MRALVAWREGSFLTEGKIGVLSVSSLLTLYSCILMWCNLNPKSVHSFCLSFTFSWNPSSKSNDRFKSVTTHAGHQRHAGFNSLPQPEQICAMSAITSATLLGPIPLLGQPALPIDGHTFRAFCCFLPDTVPPLAACGCLLLPSLCLIEYLMIHSSFSPHHIICITHLPLSLTNHHCCVCYERLDCRVHVTG